MPSPYANRIEYDTCFFKTADRLWHDINLRNDKIDISDGLYLLNLPLYNEEVVREAVNNAIAHRDYYAVPKRNLRPAISRTAQS